MLCTPWRPTQWPFVALLPVGSLRAFWSGSSGFSSFESSSYKSKHIKPSCFPDSSCSHGISCLCLLCLRDSAMHKQTNSHKQNNLEGNLPEPSQPNEVPAWAHRSFEPQLLHLPCLRLWPKAGHWYNRHNSELAGLSKSPNRTMEHPILIRFSSRCGQPSLAVSAASSAQSARCWASDKCPLRAQFLDVSYCFLYVLVNWDHAAQIRYSI